MRQFVIAGLVVVAFGVGGWLFLRGPEGAPNASKEEHHEEAEGPHVELTGDQIAKAGINVEVAGQATIRETLPLYGVISPNAERTGEVVARFPGTVRSVSKKLGDTVKQGEALATVESNESLQAYAVASPVSGVIVARSANPGEQTGDKILFTVADLSTVWIELSLFPRDVAKVHVGQKAIILNADAGLRAEGEVVYVAPVGNAASQTRTVRVLLDNADRNWAPAIYVTAEIVLGESPVAVAVRTESVQNLDGADVVFARTDEGFAPRPVKLGRNDTEYTEIMEGLKGGEAYAVTNSFILKAELGKGEAEHEH